MAAPTPSSSSASSSFDIDRSVSKNINALLDGIKWGSGGVGTAATIYYSFPVSNASSLWSSAYTADSNSELYSGFAGLSSSQQTQATLALQSWATVANIDLQYVATETSTAVGDIRVAFTTGSDMDASTYAYAYYPASESYGGDVWLNANAPVSTGADFSLGANGYQTLVHELGHALGLAHPFEGSVKLSAQYDNFKYTMMSYSDAPNHEDSGFSSYYPTTPMLLDILAIQYLYGANTTYATGDNVYTFDDAGTYYQTIWDAGGTDTIQYDSDIGGTINLTAGSFSTMGQAITRDNGTSVNDTIAIAYSVTIENAIGGNGNDTIIGNTANNALDGGAGADQLTGGKGDDRYTVDFSLSGSLVVLQDTMTEKKNAGNDTLILRGSVTQTQTLSALTLLSNIENIDLSLTNAFDLNLTGNKFANILTGNAGNNVLNGGAGADTLAGGEGNDTYVLDRAGDIVTESDAEGTDTVIIQFKQTGTYTLADAIENATLSNSKNFNLIGNSAENTLTGNAKANTLNGGAGEDILSGNAGKDTLIGGADHDVLTGGTGADTFVWALADKGSEGAAVIDNITDFSLTQKDKLNLSDLLVNESAANISNFIDIALSGSNTEFRISSNGNFSSGVYDASKEDARIVLENVDLLGGSSDATLLASLLGNNRLIIG